MRRAVVSGIGGATRTVESPRETALRFDPVNRDRWTDLEAVLGSRGGHDGCWCMRWRMPRLDFERSRGDRNRRALRAGVVAGSVTGIVGYLEDRPVAWCAVGPRAQFPVLDTTDVLARVDDSPVWSIGCCCIARGCRRRGYSGSVLRAAVDYAADNGAEVVEGYPLVPRTERVPVAAAWTGFASAYREAGFMEVARRVELRPIVRRVARRADVEGSLGGA